jgi:hypothetical protein
LEGSKHVQVDIALGIPEFQEDLFTALVDVAQRSVNGSLSSLEICRERVTLYCEKRSRGVVLDRNRRMASLKTLNYECAAI